MAVSELYMLAFDHRDVFRGEPRAVEAKQVVYEGFLHGLEGGIERVRVVAAPEVHPGLVDRCLLAPDLEPVDSKPRDLTVPSS